VLARPDVDSVKPQERFRSQTVEVAIKITNIAKVSPKEQQGIKEALRREIAMLGTLRHPSLIRLFGVQVNDTTALLVLPHCAGGDMFDLASSSDGKLKPPLVRRMFAELANAVAYLHRHNVVHRDIKLESMWYC
jgi:protein-serine/threonine kinase